MLGSMAAFSQTGWRRSSEFYILIWLRPEETVFWTTRRRVSKPTPTVTYFLQQVINSICCKDKFLGWMMRAATPTCGLGIKYLEWTLELCWFRKVVVESSGIHELTSLGSWLGFQFQAWFFLLLNGSEVILTVGYHQEVSVTIAYLDIYLGIFYSP